MVVPGSVVKVPHSDGLRTGQLGELNDVHVVPFAGGVSGRGLGSLVKDLRCPEFLPPVVPVLFVFSRVGRDLVYVVVVMVVMVVMVVVVVIMVVVVAVAGAAVA